MAYAPKFLSEKALLSNNLGNIKRAIINQLQKEIQNMCWGWQKIDSKIWWWYNIRNV